jgi:hypothetical protein
MFATQTMRNLGSKATQHDVGRINDKPVALDFSRLGRKGFHVINLLVTPEAQRMHSGVSPPMPM